MVAVFKLEKLVYNLIQYQNGPCVRRHKEMLVLNGAQSKKRCKAVVYLATVGAKVRSALYTLSALQIKAMTSVSQNICYLSIVTCWRQNAPAHLFSILHPLTAFPLGLVIVEIFTTETQQEIINQDNIFRGN